MDLGAIDRGDLAGQFAAATIEEDDFGAGFKAQDIARMMRLRATQRRRVRIPLVRPNVEAMHRENDEIRNPKYLGMSTDYADFTDYFREVALLNLCKSAKSVDDS